MRIRIGIIIGALVLGWWGFKEYRLASGAKAAPQVMSCEVLGASGPGKNAHVTMNDFYMVDHFFVYAEKKRRWEAVWVPVVPLNGTYYQELVALVEKEGDQVELPAPKDFKIIAKFTTVQSEHDLIREGDKDSLTGMVINEIDSLGSDEKRLLAQNYPGVDVERCWILEVGRKPKSMMLTLGAMLLALAAIAGVVIQWFMAQKKAEAQRLAQRDRDARRRKARAERMSAEGQGPA